MGYNIDKSEVDQLAKYLGEKKKSVKLRGMDPYDTPVLICIDAVLSICRRYKGFVVPRIDYFKKNGPNIITLDQLVKFIEKEGPEKFEDYWNYYDINRVNTLYNLAKKLIEMEHLFPAETEMASLRKWASSVNVECYNFFGVSGIGIATFQYLRIMLGVPTVKPDIYIKRVVSCAVNRNVHNELEVIKLFESACDVINVNPNEMDYTIWEMESEGEKKKECCSHLSIANVSD